MRTISIFGLGIRAIHVGQHPQRVLQVKSPIEALLPVFEVGHIAIVMDRHKFLGMITRVDLLNYLRRRAG